MPLKIVPQRDRKLHGLFEAGRAMVVSRGEPVYEAGSPARELFLVREGHVRLTVPPCGSDRDRTAAVAGPGEVFGTEALLADGVHAYAARGGETAHLRAVSGREAFRFIRSARNTLPRLLEASLLDLARARWPGAGGAGPPAAQRLADLLLELAQRFGSVEEDRVRIPHWFTHEELADLVGAHRSTVTTLLNEWIYEGLLEGSSNEIHVLRRTELAERASGREAWITGR